MIVENGSFWRQLQQLQALLELPSRIIGALERDSSDISQVYHYFMRLYKHFSVGNPQAKEVFGESIITAVRELIEQRWNFIHTASMGFAYMLCPKHMNGTWLPHDKADTQVQLKQYVEVFYEGDFKKMEQCEQEIRNFLMMGMTATPAQIQLYASLTGLEYWALYGTTDYPLLGEIAKRLFTVPTSSAAAERTWSAFSFMWSKRRNRLLAKKVEKLVFLYTNAALLDDTDDTDYIRQLSLGEWMADAALELEEQAEEDCEK